MADNTGIFDVNGAVMDCPGPTTFRRITRRNDDKIISTVYSSSLANSFGTVVSESNGKQKSADWYLWQHEAVQLNGFFSGTERFESGSNIPFYFSGSSFVTYYSYAERNLYYSKSTSLQLPNKLWASSSFDKFKGLKYKMITGLTTGITDSTSSNPFGYAVLTYLSGNLATTLEKEYGISNPSWYLSGNGFGTPYVPDSSMSLGAGSAVEIDKKAAADILNISVNQMPTLPGQNDMTAFLARLGYSMDAATAAELRLQPTTSSTYFPLP